MFQSPSTRSNIPGLGRRRVWARLMQKTVLRPAALLECILLASLALVDVSSHGFADCKGRRNVAGVRVLDTLTQSLLSRVWERPGLRTQTIPRLRGAGGSYSASDVWDVKTGKGVWGAVDPIEEYEDDSCSDGEDADITVFRHVTSGVAVEIVNDIDDEDCRGFFRFLTAEIFDILPDSPHYANFSHACPGWVCLVNGYCTGDWLQAKGVYAELKASPGDCLYSKERMTGSNWTMAPRQNTSEESRNATGPGEEEVLEHKGGNWTVWERSGCIFIQHKGCRDAQIVLTVDGFVYIASKDPFGVLSSDPVCVEVNKDMPHRKLTLQEAVRRRNTYMILSEPPDSYPPLSVHTSHPLSFFAASAHTLETTDSGALSGHPMS